jgi:hypothetical protein
MEKKPYVKEQRFKIPLIPEMYPPLKRKFEPLDMEEEKYEKIGNYSRDLIKFSKQNIYKLLYMGDTLSECGLKSEAKTIRNSYMKKLAQSNEENFPAELGKDRTSKASQPTLEEKRKKLYEELKLKNKTPETAEKKKPEKKERKESIIEQEVIIEKKAAKKESNKKDGKESLKKPFIEEGLKDNIEDDLESVDKDEEEEEQSNADEDNDYKMASDDEGDDNDGGNDDDEGVFYD